MTSTGEPPKLGMMEIKLPFPLKLGTLVGLGILFIIGGLFLFDKKIPLIKREARTQEEGAVFGIRSQIPAEFPSDVPLFEPSTVRSTTKSQRWVHVVLESEESLEDVLKFYQGEMERLDWEGIQTFKPKGGEAWVFSKDDERLELIVVRNEEEEKTLIFLKSNLP